MSKQEVKIEVDITGTDKFRAMAALTAQAIMTHPNRHELQRAFYEIVGVPVEAEQNKCSG